MDRELLLRFVRCETTPDEESIVLEWLEADPRNQRELDRLDALCNAVTLHAPADTSSRRKSLFSSAFVRYSGMVAAAIALIIGGGWLFTTNMRGQMSTQMTTIVVPDGQRISLVLQDSTRIWLNSRTTFEYPAVFAQNDRRVKISGEAMFDVTPNAEKPFVVETFAGDVEVLGTQFNLLADEQTNEFSTSLIRGRVRVTNRFDPADQVILTPDQYVSLVNGHLNRGQIENPDEFLWTEGIISLSGASFEELITKFERAFAIQINVRRATLPELKCRGKIRTTEGIEHAMEMLRTGGDFAYEIDHQRNELTIY